MYSSHFGVIDKSFSIRFNIVLLTKINKLLRTVRCPFETLNNSYKQCNFYEGVEFSKLNHSVLSAVLCKYP